MEARTVGIKNGETLVIRVAQPADAEKVLHHVQAVGAETDNFSYGAGEFEGTVEDLREEIEVSQSKENALFLLAFIGEELVGLISFEGGKRLRNKHVGDFSISVRQSHWGRGIGEQLLQGLIAWAHSSSLIRKINVTVRADNRAAIALYKKAGFVQEGVKLRDAFIGGEFIDSCRMGLEIDPEGGIV